MQNFKSEAPALEELSSDAQEQVTGGFGLAVVAGIGALWTIYNLGKVVGDEAYRYAH